MYSITEKHANGMAVPPHAFVHQTCRFIITCSNPFHLLRSHFALVLVLFLSLLMDLLVCLPAGFCCVFWVLMAPACHHGQQQ